MFSRSPINSHRARPQPLMGYNRPVDTPSFPLESRLMVGESSQDTSTGSPEERKQGRSKQTTWQDTRKETRLNTQSNKFLPMFGVSRASADLLEASDSYSSSNSDQDVLSHKQVSDSHRDRTKAAGGGILVTDDDLEELEYLTSLHLEESQGQEDQATAVVDDDDDNDEYHEESMDFISEKDAEELERIAQDIYSQMHLYEKDHREQPARHRQRGPPTYSRRSYGSEDGSDSPSSHARNRVQNIIFVVALASFVIYVLPRAFYGAGYVASSIYRAVPELKMPNMTLNLHNTPASPPESLDSIIGAGVEEAISDLGSKIVDDLRIAQDSYDSMARQRMGFFQDVAESLFGVRRGPILKPPHQSWNSLNVSDYARESNGAKIIYNGPHARGYCPTVTDDTFLGLKIWDLYQDESVHIICNPPSVVLAPIPGDLNYWLYEDDDAVNFAIQFEAPLLLQTFSLVNIQDELNTLNPTELTLWGKLPDNWTTALSEQLDKFVPQPANTPEDVPNGYVYLMDVSSRPYYGSYSQDFPPVISGLPISEVFVQVHKNRDSQKFGRIYRLKVYGSDYGAWLAENTESTNKVIDTVDHYIPTAVPQPAGGIVVNIDSGVRNDFADSELGGDEELI